MPGQVGFLACDTPSRALGWMAERAPGLPILAAGPLCEREAWVRDWAATRSLTAAVVVACGDPCWARLATALAALGPLAIHRLEAAGPDARRFEALAWGKVQRARADPPVPPEGIKYRLALDGGSVSRRDLLGFPLRRRAVPVPLVDAAACRRLGRCRRCLEACPLGALTHDGATVRLDRARCDGCGFCVTACPQGALGLPGVSLEAVLQEIRAVLSVRGAPRVALFDCEAHGDTPLPRDVFRLALPCVGMLSLRWLLAPLAEGAAGVLVLESSERCRPWHAGPRAGHAVGVARLVLSGLGASAERVALVGSLADAERRAIQLVTLPRPPSLRSSPGADGPPSLATVIRTLAAGNGHRPPIASELLPFGTVSVDRARCALCGVCAGACPVSALSFFEEPRRAGLVFDASRCDGCRACEPDCPERAISVRRELRVEQLDVPRLLHQGRMLRCRRCGTAVASANLVRAVRARLGGSVARVPPPDLCPACRVGSHL